MFYLEQHSWPEDIVHLTSNLVFLNKYHDEFVEKIDDGLILPVIGLDRLQNTEMK